MSAPAQKALSPVPVTSSARASPSATWSRAAPRSLSNSKFNEFNTSGRSSVTSASSSMRVTLRGIASSPRSPGWIGPTDRGRPNETLPRPGNELALQDFAAGREWKRLHRDEIFGHVVTRQPGAMQMGEQLLRFDALTGVRDHGETDP